ncbi:MAG: VTT domain-containing protein [Propionibacteriaceae bacterium]|nr:VTT domain-containing protein [Propionibacteriaceae bacterium]
MSEESKPAESVTAPEQEQEWWQAEGMPWKRKPGRAEVACMTWFGVAAVYGLVMMPLRAWLIAAAPDILAMITGGRATVAASGALAATGRMSHWLLVLVVASVFSLKFDWIYWWAGKLWGRGMIEVWAGRSKRAARNYALVEKWAKKLGPWGFVVAYLPIPLPLAAVVFVLSGATGLSLKRFLLYDYLASTAWLVFYFWLGWGLGEPAVALLDAYAKIAGYVAIGMLVVIFVSSYLKQRQKAAETAAQG